MLTTDTDRLKNQHFNRQTELVDLQPGFVAAKDRMPEANGRYFQ